MFPFYSRVVIKKVKIIFFQGFEGQIVAENLEGSTTEFASNKTFCINTTKRCWQCNYVFQGIVKVTDVHKLYIMIDC